jgi:hypothetical protein
MRRDTHQIRLYPWRNSAPLRQVAVELGDTSPLVEEGKPVLSRPAIAALAKKRDHAHLVIRQQIEQRRRRRRGGFEREVIAIDRQLDAGGARGLEGFRRAHSRALQPDVPTFSGAECRA